MHITVISDNSRTFACNCPFPDFAWAVLPSR